MAAAVPAVPPAVLPAAVAAGIALPGLNKNLLLKLLNVNVGTPATGGSCVIDNADNLLWNIPDFTDIVLFASFD